jgi:hypothetical protein
VQVVQRDGLGRVFHHVEDVVHAGDQLVDVVAVDRRDEGLVQQVDGGVGDLVRLFFDALDRRARGFPGRRNWSSGHHLVRTLHAQSACWLNRSKNLPSVGIRRPNMYCSPL